LDQLTCIIVIPHELARASSTALRHQGGTLGSVDASTPQERVASPRSFPLLYIAHRTIGKLLTGHSERFASLSQCEVSCESFAPVPAFLTKHMSSPEYLVRHNIIAKDWEQKTNVSYSQIMMNAGTNSPMSFMLYLPTITLVLSLGWLVRVSESNHILEVSGVAMHD
jgi:hypothetical protein